MMKPVQSTRYPVCKIIIKLFTYLLIILYMTNAA